MIDCVSELLRLPWTEIYGLPVTETLSYLNYYNYKIRKQEEELRKFRKGM